MFPHFSLRRERSACLHQVFASSCFVSFGSGLGLVFFWFGLVWSCSAWRAGRISRPLSRGCMFVGCQLVDVMMMIRDSREKDYVFRPVVLYRKFCTTQQVCTSLPCVRRLGQCQSSRTPSPRRYGEFGP